jgi:hypothetical protein
MRDSSRLVENTDSIAEAIALVQLSGGWPSFELTRQ